MTQESQAIEVEVVQIDGVAPPARAADAPERNARQQPRQNWQGRIRRFDGRWWPLWVVLAVVAVFLILTVGLVIGAIYLVLRIIGKVIRWITRRG